jgi:hypothetical protein
MFDWLKILFGAFDRQQAGADRAAAAMEGIAEDLETTRDAIHARLTGTTPAIADDTNSGNGGGRRARLTIRSSSSDGAKQRGSIGTENWRLHLPHWSPPPRYLS